MKKQLLLLGILLSSFVCWTYAQADLSEAEQLYRDGRFAEALGSYEKELKLYPNDPFLYYNIGNAYFKMGSNGLAVANYYRAYRLLPRDKDIRHNLALALASSGEQLVPADIPAVAYQAFFCLSYDELKGLTYALFWLLALVGWVWLVKRKAGKVAVVLLVLFGISATWLYARHSLQTRTLAVVAAPSAEIRSGPGTNFPANATAAQGHLLDIVDKKDQWYEVIVNSQSIKGWVESSAIEKI